MSHISPFFVACLFSLLAMPGSILAASLNPSAAATEGEWQALFNGRDLAGWTAKITGHPLGADPNTTFRVQDGLLKVRYDNYETFAGQFGHLFYQKRLSHYALHIEYRFVGQQLKGGPAGWAVRNSGVMFHAQAADTMTQQQDFPISIEAQFLGGLSNDQPRPTANVCTPGTGITVDGSVYPKHCLNSQSATYDGGQWVNVTIVVLGGGSITHYVEGEEVLSYQQPTLDEGARHAKGDVGQQSLAAGYIALQSESHPIDFRQVRLLNLSGCTDPKAKNYKSYFLKSNPERCRY